MLRTMPGHWLPFTYMAAGSRSRYWEKPYFSLMLLHCSGRKPWWYGSEHTNLETNFFFLYLCWSSLILTASIWTAVKYSSNVFVFSCKEINCHSAFQALETDENSMFQYCSLKTSHPCPPLLWPKVCSLCLRLLAACKYDHLYYLSRFHRYALMYNINIQLSLSFWLTSFCIIGSRFIPSH